MKNEEILFFVFLAIAFFASFAYITGYVIFTEPGNISECGDISVTGVYNLTNNTNISETCFRLYANHSILDCKGFNITGNGSYRGIEIFGMNNTIKNCIISNFTEGIFANPISRRNTIKNNKLTLNRHGVYLDHSPNNTLSNNLMSNNIFSGIYDKESINTTITANTLYDNNDSGIYLSRTKNTKIIDNNITKNIWGVSIINSINVTIFNNYFFNSFNAYDDSPMGMIRWNLNQTIEETNIIGGDWKGGNYWHDYMGKDEDGDGIGDTYLPYDSYDEITNGGDNMPLTSISVEEEPELYQPNETQLLKGYVQELDIDDEIEFYLDSDRHYLTMLDFNDEEDNESIKIRIESSPQIINLDLNEKKEIDVDTDNIKDISVKFIGFSSGNLPRINLTLLPQPTQQPPTNQTPQTNQTTTTTTPTFDYDYQDTESDYDEPAAPLSDYQTETETEEPSEGGGFLTIMLLILLFGGAAFAAWFFLMRKKPGTVQPQPGQPRPPAMGPRPPAQPGQPGFRQPMPRRPMGPPVQPQPGQPRPPQ